MHQVPQLCSGGSRMKKIEKWEFMNMLDEMTKEQLILLRNQLNRRIGDEE